jgi:hypothetical protein
LTAPNNIKTVGAMVAGMAARLEKSLLDVGAGPGSIAPDETFYDWCIKLADAGLVVDGIPFSLVDREALVPLYRCVPTTIAEANRRTIVVMKAAQCGLTLWAALISLYFCTKFEPCVWGTFMPDAAVASDLSERRILPIIRSIPAIHRHLTTRTAPDGSTISLGEGNKLTRVLGAKGRSALLFNWTSSAIGTESRPMDGIGYDEVQGMSLSDIDRVMERTSASRIRFRVLISTANLPESDIAAWWERGTRNCYHSFCKSCGQFTDLSAFFPDCIAYNYGQFEGAPVDYVYVCPPTAGGCGARIEDSQRGGKYIPQAPNAAIESYHIAQTVSPR